MLTPGDMGDADQDIAELIQKVLDLVPKLGLDGILAPLDAALSGLLVALNPLVAGILTVLQPLLITLGGVVGGLLNALGIAGL